MAKFSMTQMTGVIPAMITLFDEHENVDVKRTRELTEFLISRGADGLYLTGSTGRSGRGPHPGHRPCRRYRYPQIHPAGTARRSCRRGRHLLRSPVLLEILQ